jgi:hypothetical protein
MDRSLPAPWNYVLAPFNFVAAVLMVLAVMVFFSPVLTTAGVLVEAGVGWEPTWWLALLIPGTILVGVGSLAFIEAVSRFRYAVLAVPAYCLTEACLLLFAFHRMSPAFTAPIGILGWFAYVTAGLLAANPRTHSDESMLARVRRGLRPRTKWNF